MRTGTVMTYRPELDALRGIAVLLVIGGHLYVPGLLGGGNVGVTLFFVLSGYLITSILRENHDLVRFYKPASPATRAGAGRVVGRPLWWPVP